MLFESYLIEMMFFPNVQKIETLVLFYLDDSNISYSLSLPLSLSSFSFS
jgi:hypothetical protein